jgi:hypothetical protein
VGGRLAAIIAVLAAVVLVPVTALPATTATSREAGASRIACGSERWPVKTLTDSMARQVNLVPRPTTVRALRRIPRPSSPPENGRVRPIETTTYRVRARLVRSKFEDEQDFHLVIADPVTGGTMIVEFPAFSCTRAARPALRRRMQAARAAFIRACGTPSASDFTQLRGTATITGVGFFNGSTNPRLQAAIDEELEMRPPTLSQHQSERDRFLQAVLLRPSSDSNDSNGNSSSKQSQPTPGATQ